MFLHLKTKQRSVFRYDKLSDEELILHFRETKNLELISELFDRYTHLVYGICLKYLRNRAQCKDAVMEIFEGLFEKLLEHEVNHFKNWLYSVSKNYCLMALRKGDAFVKFRHKLLGTIQQESEEMNPEDLAQKEMESSHLSGKSVLMQAVEQLNQEQNTCLRMLYLEEKSYKEISDMTGYSLKKVKSCVQNGKRNLKNYLFNHYGAKRFQDFI